MAENFFESVDWCIQNRRPHALCIPWVNRDSGDSIDAAVTGLVSRGWVYSELLDRYERAGWYLWFRSQGGLASPIAQFNKIDGWGDGPDGWGDHIPDVDEVDEDSACPDCGDYTENGLQCLGCRSAERVRTTKQLTLF